MACLRHTAGSREARLGRGAACSGGGRRGGRRGRAEERDGGRQRLAEGEGSPFPGPGAQGSLLLERQGFQSRPPRPVPPRGLCTHRSLFRGTHLGGSPQAWPSASSRFQGQCHPGPPTSIRTPSPTPFLPGSSIPHKEHVKGMAHGKESGGPARRTARQKRFNKDPVT